MSNRIRLIGLLCAIATVVGAYFVFNGIGYGTVDISLVGPDWYHSRWKIPRKYLSRTENMKGGRQGAVVLSLSMKELKRLTENESENDSLESYESENNDDITIILSFGGVIGGFDKTFEQIKDIWNFSVVNENFKELKLFRSLNDTNIGSNHVWAKPVDEKRYGDIYMWVLSDINSQNTFIVYCEINNVASLELSYSLRHIGNWKLIDRDVRKFVMHFYQQ